MNPTTIETSRCRHFGVCGGCQHQDVDYALQLERKAADLQVLLCPFWPDEIPITPSPSLWHYRNKMDFTFGFRYYDTPPPKDFPRELVIGLKQKGRWFRPIDVEECLIAMQGVDSLLSNVRDWARLNGLQPFDARKRTGCLKNLLVREGTRTGEHMIVLLTYSSDVAMAGFTEAVLDAYPDASVHWAVSDSLAHVAMAPGTTLLHGGETIEERYHISALGNEDLALRFRVSPFSFLQTNTLGAEVLYSQIRAWVKDVAPDVLYDLYGGSGGIALSCTSCVDSVVSVESVASASDDGRYNAQVNGIDNVSFITEPVEVYLHDIASNKSQWDTKSAVILDPPRSGLHPKALNALDELEPAHIVYISCKPAVFAKEMERLAQRYRIVRTAAVDMFPHTDHVELMAHLSLKSISGG